MDVIRKDVEEKDFMREEAALKSLKAKITYEVAVSKELKEYTINTKRTSCSPTGSMGTPVLKSTNKRRCGRGLTSTLD